MSTHRGTLEKYQTRRDLIPKTGRANHSRTRIWELFLVVFLPPYRGSYLRVVPSLPLSWFHISSSSQWNGMFLNVGPVVQTGHEAPILADANPNAVLEALKVIQSCVTGQRWMTPSGPRA